MDKVYKQIPVIQLTILKKQHEIVQEEFFELNTLFEVAVENIDFDFYGEEREKLESYLCKLNKIRDNLSEATKRLQNLKLELAN